MHLEGGDHVAELVVEATKKREDELPIADRIAVLDKRGGHRLETAAIVGDVQRTLMEVAKLRLEEERARFAVAKELAFEIAPGMASRGLSQHQGLLQVVGDSVVDPRQDDAVRLRPCWARGEGRVLEDMAS